MKFDPISRLKVHMDSIKSRGGLTYSEMVDILRRIRLLIESPGVKKTYPVLAIYCDWVMHVELDRNPGGHEILRAVDRSIVDSWHGDPSGTAEGVSDALDLSGLRREILQLFQINDIDSTIFTVNENWIEFVRGLLIEIAERPIMFPQGVATDASARGRKTFLAMQDYRSEKGVPTALTVTRITIAFKEKDDNGDAGYYWFARLREDSPEHYVQLSGPLVY